jgi:hypothetical protein
MKPLGSPNLNELRQALRKSRGRGTWRAGVVSLILGVVLLASGYLTRYLFFEIDALVAMLLGLVLVFRTTQPEPWREIGVRGLVSLYASLSDLFPKERSALRTMYLPGTGAGGPVAAVPFLNVGQDGEVGSSAAVAEILTVSPPGGGLFSVLSEQLPNLKGIGASALINLLPKILADDLELAKSVNFTTAGNVVRMTVEGSAFRQVFSRDQRAAEALGCPTTSAVAALLAEATGSRIGFACSYQRESGLVSATFEIQETAEKEHG